MPVGARFEISFEDSLGRVRWTTPGGDRSDRRHSMGTPCDLDRARPPRSRSSPPRRPAGRGASRPRRLERQGAALVAAEPGGSIDRGGAREAPTSRPTLRPERDWPSPERGEPNVTSPARSETSPRRDCPVREVTVREGSFEASALEKLLVRHVEYRRSDAVGWTACLYHLTDAQMPQGAAKAVVESRDCMSMASLLAMSQHESIVNEFVSSLDPTDLYYLDRYWLLLHELNLHGALPANGRFDRYIEESGLAILKGACSLLPGDYEIGRR